MIDEPFNPDEARIVVDAADVKWESTHPGSALAMLLYTTEPRPPWWRWRARRRWFRPRLFTPPPPGPDDCGGLDIVWGGGDFTMTLDETPGRD